MDKLRLSRFRSINEPLEIDIKPITILVGQNNSGKSSVIKALLFLSDYLDQKEQQYIDYTGRYSSKHKLFNFNNTKNWVNKDNSFNIGFSKDKFAVDFNFIGSENESAKLKSFSIFKNKNLGISLENNASKIDLTADLNVFDKIQNSVNLVSKIIDDRKKIGFTSFSYDLAFFIKNTLSNSWGEHNTPGINPRIHDFDDNFKSLLLQNIHYLGPNRTNQARLYSNNGGSQEINEVCNEYLKNRPPFGSGADLFLKKWLRAFGIGNSLEVKPYANNGNSVEIKMDSNVETINLADKGFGAGQLTTVLMKIANMINVYHNPNRLVMNFGAPDQMLLIEEPEANLHPKLQSLLADMFIEAYQKFKIKFVIETHSEYLIRKLQCLTAKKEISPADSVIYYFNNPLTISAGEKQILKIEIEKDGCLSNEFGSGFFDEALNLEFELLKIKNRN